MASAIAHPFVALALSPFFRRFGITAGVGALGAACTLLPDLDVVGFHFGVPHSNLFGHRGFSHSLFFAAAWAATLTFAIRNVYRQVPRVALFVFFFLCTASHGVLDALTNGGPGIGFFSPFSNQRYFFAWRPLAVSPLSISGFFPGRAATILASEIRWVMLPSLLVFLAGRLATRRPIALA